MSSSKYTGADIVAQYNKARAQAQKDANGSRVSNATLTEAVNKQLSGNTKAQEYIQSARESNQEVNTAQQAINKNPTIATQRENSYERMLTRQYDEAVKNLRKASSKADAVTQNAAMGTSMSDNNLAAQIKGANLTAKLKGEAGDTEGKTYAQEAAKTYQKLLDARKSAVSEDGTIQNVKTTTTAQQENLKYANRNLDYAEKQLETAAENFGKDQTKENLEAYTKAAQYYSSVLESVSTDTYMTTYTQEAASNKVQEYIRENASEELGTQLQETLTAQEDKVKRLKKEADKLLNKGDAEGYNEKMAEANALETSTQTTYIRQLIQLNDDYQNNATNISKMTDKEFQQTYSGYTAAKEEAQGYEDEASKYLKLADKALARKDMTAYARYTALAEQERSKAEEALSEYGDLDKETEYTIENRLSTLELEDKAKADLDMKWYVDLGEKSTFVPTSRTLSGNLPIDSESGSMDTPAVTQLLPQMSEDEKRVYNYYLGKRDTESAQEYFTLLEPTLEERYMQEVQSTYSSFTTEHPVLGTVANAVSAATFQPVMGALGTLESAAKGVKETMEGTYTPPLTNTLMQTASGVNEATVTGLSQNLMNHFGLSEESANFWAGTVVSVLNNAAQSGAFRIGIAKAAKEASNTKEAIDAIAKMGEWVPLALMGTTAATDAVREQLASGNDLGKSLIYGGVVGAMEIITEKIGVDSWVDMATGGLSENALSAVYQITKITGGKIDYTVARNAVITVLGLGKQALSEGTEEVISEVVDTLADIAINGENSECSQRMWSYILEGYTESEARRMAFQDVAENVWYSWLGGAVSGGIFGLAAIPNNLRTGSYLGQSLINQGKDLDQVAAGLKFDPDTETYRIAKTISDKLDRAEEKGKTYLPKAGELTQLTLAMEQDMQKAAAETPSIALEETQAEDGALSSFATELLETGTVTNAVAESAGAVMEKIVSGETVTDSDIRDLRADIPKVREILNEKLGASLENGSTEEVRAAIETYQEKAASAGTQAEGMKNGSQIIREAIPGAKALANADSEAQVEAAFSGVEAAAQESVAAQEAQNSAYAAAKAQGDIEAIQRDVGRGNLNYGVFSNTYKTYFPEANSEAIRSVYRQANETYQKQGSALIGVDGDTMLYFTEKGFQEISRENLAQWAQEATGTTPTAEELEEMFQLVEGQEKSGKDGAKVFSLDELWDQVQEEGSTSVRYSIDESFAEKLDAWNGSSNEAFKVGTTSDVLKSIGVRDTSIVWRGRKIAAILKKHSGMTMDIIKQVPNILEDPVVILKSQQSETRLSIFGEVNDAKGVPVTAILELQPTNKGGQLLDMNIIASAYGKDVNLKGFIEKSGVVYLDTDKNRTDTWLQCRGLKLPLNTTMLGSVGSVTYLDGNVKIDAVPWSQLTQTETVQKQSLDADTTSEQEAADREAPEATVSELDTVEGTEEKPQEQKAPKERILSAGEYSQENPNKIAEWLSYRAAKLFEGKGIDSVTVSYDMDADEGNGYYVYKDGKATIILNGQKGETTRDGQHYTAQQNISFIIGHELTHRGQTGSNLTETTGDFTGQVISAYQTVTGVTDDQVDEEIQKRFQRYRNYAAETGNIDLSDIDLEYGRKEYAADCMGEMMTKYNLLRKMASQDRNLVQQALDKVKAFAGKAGDLVNKLSDRHVTRNLSEAKIYAAEADTMAELLRDGLSRAEGTKNTATEGGEGKRYTIDEDAGLYVSDTEIQEGIQSVAQMEPVAELTGQEFQGEIGDTGHLVKTVTDLYNSIGNKVQTQQVGEVALNKRGVKDDLAHGLGRAKAAAFAAVPDVLRAGRVIDFSENWKGRRYQTAVIAAPVTINGEAYLEGVVIKRSQGNTRFYVHEVLTQKEGAPPFNTGAAKNSGLPGGDAPSVVSLLQKVKSVNTSTDENSENRSYSVDEDWGDDSGSPVNPKIGNVTESQQFKRWFGDWQNHPNIASKVVNADGTPKVMYHGTSNYGFHVFDTFGGKFGLFGMGSYCTDDASVAESYTTKNKGDSPGVYQVYLNIRNPLDMDAEADFDQWIRAFEEADLDAGFLVDYETEGGYLTNEGAFKALKAAVADQGYAKWEGEELVTGMIESMGFDGITHTGGGRINKQDTNRHQVYIAFYPEQIKSATDNIGTFDRNNPDIRYSLDEDWEEDLPISGEKPTSGFDAYRNGDGIEDTLESGTRLLSKQDSQSLARELRNSFGSRIRTNDLATSLRQIADTADGMVEMYLRMVQEPMTSEEAQQLWDEQYAPVEAMAYELADEIIDQAEQGGALDTEAYAQLRQALTGDHIYVPENLREDVARGLGYETWGEARKARLNILGKTVNDPARGTSIDVIYNNLVDSAPFAVSGDAVNPADQLVEMINAYDKAAKPSDRYNTLAQTQQERQENRKKIAERICAEMTGKASAAAGQAYNQYLSDKKAEAERLSQEAARQQARADRLARSNRNTEGAAAAAQEAESLKSQAQEAKLLGQTDEETIREGLEESGVKIKTRQEAAETAQPKQETTKRWTDMDPQERLDSIMRQVMAQNSKGGTKVSKLNTNTFTKGGFFNEVERADAGLRETDMQYKVVTEKESMQEAADRLSRDYLYWFETLPKKADWSAKDFDTAMMILHQVQTESRKTGDTKELSRWANLIQPHTTEAGRMIQACKKYTRTAEYATIKMVENLDENYIHAEEDSKKLKDISDQNKQKSSKAKQQDKEAKEAENMRKRLLAEAEKLRKVLEDTTETEENTESGTEAKGQTGSTKTKPKATKGNLNTILKQMQQLDRLATEYKALAETRDEGQKELQKLLVDVSRLSRKNGSVVQDQATLDRQLKSSQEQARINQRLSQLMRECVAKLNDNADQQSEGTVEACNRDRQQDPQRGEQDTA